MAARASIAFMLLLLAVFAIASSAQNAATRPVRSAPRRSGPDVGTLPAWYNRVFTGRGLREADPAENQQLETTPRGGKDEPEIPDATMKVKSYSVKNETIEEILVGLKESDKPFTVFWLNCDVVFDKPAPKTLVVEGLKITPRRVKEGMAAMTVPDANGDKLPISLAKPADVLMLGDLQFVGSIDIGKGRVYSLENMLLSDDVKPSCIKIQKKIDKMDAAPPGAYDFRAEGADDLLHFEPAPEIFDPIPPFQNPDHEPNPDTGFDFRIEVGDNVVVGVSGTDDGGALGGVGINFG